MKAKYSILSFAILFIALFSGCSNDDFEEVVGLCPVVISTNPADEAVNVPLDRTISVLFNKEMNPTTITESSFTIEGAGSTLIEGDVSLNGATASFNPINSLAINTTYIGSVKTAVKDLRGNALQQDYIFTFSTGSIITPVVTSTDPLNLATNVFINKTVSAKFNVMMDPTTINTNTFTLKQGTTDVAGEVTYSGQSAFYNPTVNLLVGKEYTATITTGAKNLDGTALGSDYTWTFTTGTTVAPTVTSTDPINNATGVALNKVINADFSVAMNNSTINTSTFTLKQGTTVIAGAVTYSGQTAFFNPSVNLMSGTEYTAAITTGAKNLQGIPLVSDFTWKFTTGTTVAPTVISTDPLNNASGVALNKVIAANFSTAMDPTTINSTSFTLKNGATVVNGALSYSGTTLTFVPQNLLVGGTTYTATVTTEAKSVAGVPLANNYVWKFNTMTTGGTGVDLQTVARFGIIAGVGVSNNAGFSEIRNMDVGIYPGVRSSIVGFPPAIVVNGAIYASDDVSPAGVPAMLLQAKNDLTAAYLFAEGASSPAPVTVSGDQGGLTLTPGIYKSTSTLLIQTGDLTLDAQGNPNATWIFQIASDFTTVGGAGGNIILAGGAKAKNVFWQVGSSATIGDYTIFKGNVLALTSITMNGYATAEGRMLARNGAVVMTHTNIITKPVD